MGELLNNVLKGIVASFWFVLVVGGLYVSAATWAADTQRDIWANQYRRAATVEQRNKIAGWLDEFDVVESAKILILRPKAVYSRIQAAWPLLKNPAGNIGKGNFGPQNLTQHRWLYHIIPWPLAGLFIALLIQFIGYPVLRAKLARWLATTGNKTFGKIKDLPKGDGFVLARKVRLANNGGGNPHILTIGPSGNGKSACQALPSLLSLPDDCSCIVTDPKGELLCRAQKWLKSRGHKVYVVGPRTGYGHGWDPVWECQSVDDARELARQLLVAGMSAEDKGKGDQWINMSRACLSAYLIEAWADDAGLTDALESLFVDQASGQVLTNEQALFDYRMFQTVAGASATVGSIMATIQGAVLPWMSDEVVGWLDCNRQFRMKNIRKENAVVFLTTTAAEMKQSQPIQHVFFSRLFQYLAESGDGSRVRLLMDEFANLGKLEGIDHALNLLRSAGVGLHAFVQNASQIQSVYGHDQGDVVAESFGTICVMSGLRKDAENLAKLLGMSDTVRASHSTMDEKMRAQYTQNQELEMQANAIRELEKDQVLIISGNLKPVIAKIKPWFKIRKFYKRVDEWARKDWEKIDRQKVAAVFKSFLPIEPQSLLFPVSSSASAGDGPELEAVAEGEIAQVESDSSQPENGIDTLLAHTQIQPQTEEHTHDVKQENEI